MQWAQQLPRVSREDANLQKDTSWVIPLREPGDESGQLRQMTEYNLSVDLSATGLPVNFSAISPNTLYAVQVKKTRIRKKGGSAASSENSKKGQTPSSHLSQIFHYQLWKNVDFAIILVLILWVALDVQW